MTTSVELGPHFERFVREQVASGRHGSVSDVVQAGLRLLEASEGLQAMRMEGLGAEIAAGRASGPGHPAAPAFDRLRAKYGRIADEKGG